MSLLSTNIVVTATQSDLRNAQYIDSIRRFYKGEDISGMEVIDGLYRIPNEGKLVIYPTGKMFDTKCLDGIFPQWAERNYYNFVNNDRGGKPPAEFYRDWEKILMYDLFVRFYFSNVAVAIIENCNPIFGKMLKA